jgi:hypothetical protein
MRIHVVAPENGFFGQRESLYESGVFLEGGSIVNANANNPPRRGAKTEKAESD